LHRAASSAAPGARLSTFDAFLARHGLGEAGLDSELALDDFDVFVEEAEGEL